MSQEQEDRQSGDRTELPIERGFPIERVNEIAEKEGRAKQWYRPIYTMHKWWARRPGSLFRAISLYSLLDEDIDRDDFEIYEPGQNQTLSGSGSSREDLRKNILQVDMEDPESLWDFYSKDVRVNNKKILDPFMGGGTSLVEASRFGVNTVGMDLNPVAWFVTKKELEAGQTNISELESAFQQVEEDVADEILRYYQTPCPNGNHEAEVVYNFWIKELNCVSCGHTVPLYKDYRIAKQRYADEPGYHVLCPDCDAVSVVSDWKSNSECDECGHEWVPQNGHVSRGGYFNCPECGQKEAITDAIDEQGKPNERLYAVEYYCKVCDNQGLEKSVHKGYKQAEAEDQQRLEDARREWNTRTDLHQYVPDEEIPEGATTIVREGVNYDGHDLFSHGYQHWVDMFTDRQLLCLSKILKSIDSVSSEHARDYLLLAFSDSLMFQSTFSIYNQLRNNMEGIFRMNGYIPQRDFVENNVWGAEFGRGNFRNTWNKLIKGVEYANAPTDRYVNDGEMVESAGFAQPIGIDAVVKQGDMRELDTKNEYDAVITDPPYYDNIIYSELSDYFYVWQKILLEDEYPGFDSKSTPRKDSIVTNPFLDKTSEDFEHEMGEALEVINNALKSDGTLAFTYHHSDEESWGELLKSLCENGFEVTATYPINSDLNKFIEAREAVSFDIVIVARPFEDRIPISWNSLRRRIYKTAKDTRKTLEENRELKNGDIGVIEMGKCFQEYSKHHGKVRRAGTEMKAKQVVEEIYGIIQEDAVGEQDVYLDLLEEYNPAYSDLSKLLRRSDASEDQMKDMKLVSTSGDFKLYDWSDKERQAYVQTKVNEGKGELTDLDRAHFLRYRYEEDKSTTNYLQRWDTDSLQELCEGLAEATGDETYLRMLGVDETLADFGK